MVETSERKERGKSRRRREVLTFSQEVTPQCKRIKKRLKGDRVSVMGINRKLVPTKSLKKFNKAKKRPHFHTDDQSFVKPYLNFLNGFWKTSDNEVQG